MKKRIDDNLKPAIDFIGNSGSGFRNEEGKVLKAYKGYISSFGTMLLQNGLKAAVVLFAGDSENSEQSKLPILNALYHLKYGEVPENQTDSRKPHRIIVEDILNMSKPQLMAEREIYLDLAIALKMALRTFEFEK